MTMTDPIADMLTRKKRKHGASREIRITCLTLKTNC